MIDYKRVLICLARGSLRRRAVNDEAEIVGWATNESGEHYPIHAAQGGNQSQVPKKVILSHPKKQKIYAESLENGNVKWGGGALGPTRIWEKSRNGMNGFLKRAKEMGYTVEEG